MKIAIVFVIVFAGSLSTAQVTIQNPQQLPIPEPQVQTLHNIVCRVVAEDLHVDKGGLPSHVVLVLGQDREVTVADQANGTFTIYLKQWDEATFAMSDLQLAVQGIVLRDRWQRMAQDIVRRFRQVAPVPVEHLK